MLNTEEEENTDYDTEIDPKTRKCVVMLRKFFVQEANENSPHSDEL